MASQLAVSPKSWPVEGHSPRPRLKTLAYRRDFFSDGNDEACPL